jgi:hypothetical protein
MIGLEAREKLFSPIYSIMLNTAYWAWNIMYLPAVLRKRKEMGDSVRTMMDVKNRLSDLRVRNRQGIPFRPWVITLLSGKLYVDDIGAAVFGRWLLRMAGMESRFHILAGKEKSRWICISESKQFMISGSDLVKISPDRWRQDVLDRFGGKYRKIL